MSEGLTPSRAGLGSHGLPAPAQQEGQWEEAGSGPSRGRGGGAGTNVRGVGVLTWGGRGHGVPGPGAPSQQLPTPRPDPCLPDPRPPKPSSPRDTHLVQGWQAWSLPGEKCPGGHGAQSATESAGSAHLPPLGGPDAHPPRASSSPSLPTCHPLATTWEPPSPCLGLTCLGDRALSQAWGRGAEGR